MSRAFNRLLFSGFLELAKEYQKETDPNENGGITYTDDHVPVKTLYVSNVRINLTHGELEQYFKGQGNVSKFVLHDKGDYKYAFVTYDTCEEATKVLKRRFHNVKGCKLKVRPADTWHQPKQDNVEQKSTSMDTAEKNENKQEVKEEFDENAPSLMSLNDDCLLHLLDYFNIIELIKLLGICNRIDTLVFIKRQKYINFCFDDLMMFLDTAELTLMIVRDILQFLGPVMKSLKIDGAEFSQHSNPNRTLDWIPRHCVALENLELDNFTFNRFNVKKLIPVMQNLKSFKIGDSTKCGDEIGVLFQNAPCLEELSISGNWEITGKCLINTNNLKILNLNCCGNLQSSVFKKVLAKNKTLTELDIRRCDKLDDSVVNYIVTEVKDIEVLHINNFYSSMSNYPRFAELPNLKKLSIHFNGFTSIDPLLEKLGEKNVLEEIYYIGASSNPVDKTIEIISEITNLKTFSMAFNSNIKDNDIKNLAKLTSLESISIPGATSVTPKAMLKLVESLHKIKYLDVSQLHVDYEFLQKIILLWKKSPSRPKLEMIVYETDISESSDDVQKLLQDNKDCITVSFDPKLINIYQFMFNGSDFESDDQDDFFDLMDSDGDDDDDDDFGGMAPWEYYGDQWFDSDDSDKYMYGWGQGSP